MVQKDVGKYVQKKIVLENKLQFVNQNVIEINIVEENVNSEK